MAKTHPFQFREVFPLEGNLHSVFSCSAAPPQQRPLPYRWMDIPGTGRCLVLKSAFSQSQLGMFLSGRKRYQKKNTISESCGRFTLFFYSFREKLLILWKMALPLELCYTTTLLRKFPISRMSTYNLRTLKLSFPPKNQTIQTNNNLYGKPFSCQSLLYK